MGATFQEPNLLRLPEARAELVPQAQPKRDPELLSFVRKWDGVGKLALLADEEVEDFYQLIAVAKDQDVDRIVSDRRRRNARERRL